MYCIAGMQQLDRTEDSFICTVENNPFYFCYPLVFSGDTKKTAHVCV